MNYDLTNPLHAALCLVAFTGKDSSDETVRQCMNMAQEMLREVPTEYEFLGVYSVVKLRLEAEYASGKYDAETLNSNFAELRTALTTIAKHHKVEYKLPDDELIYGSDNGVINIESLMNLFKLIEL